MKQFVQALFLFCAFSVAARVAASQTGSIYDIPVEPMKDARATTATAAAAAPNLSAYRGRVILIVNVASKCGFTKQYGGLEELHRKYKDRGLAVLGFPCNDFGGQEPGTEQEILSFCKTKYDVTFPLFAKLHAKGEQISPLYQWLTGEGSPFPGEVRWNFEKFLISREGQLLARFPSRAAPDSAELLAAIEKALAPPDAAQTQNSPQSSRD